MTPTTVRKSKQYIVPGILHIPLSQSSVVAPTHDARTMEKHDENPHVPIVQHEHANHDTPIPRRSVSNPEP